MKWAHQNGCVWDSSTCADAASNGHLEVIKWAHQNGCVWDSWTCDCAAKNGSELFGNAKKSIQLYDNRESIVI